ncbi:MAG TPA: DNA-formamidopyrimidine glycosylase family protein [Solirubrobacterales bacterium]|nr:DNA-formamidopyrimidine glycosylase family protein [Solirubrobacterales bacterium]
MAEGDTVFRWARDLERAFEGRRVECAEAPNPRSPLRRTVSRLAGLELDRAESRGKHLLLRFRGGLVLHSHMGMNGSWRVREHGVSPGHRTKAAWLALNLGDLEVAQYGGPTIRLVREVALGRDSRLGSLGPDPLAQDFDPARAAAALATAGQTELGEALLDQRRLAGIGNIFKSEACFEARVSPWRAVDSFDPEELERIIGIARRQLLAGAETGRRPGRIYRKAGRPCPRCRGRIAAKGQGLDSRITYWCPGCQL